MAIQSIGPGTALVPANYQPRPVTQPGQTGGSSSTPSASSDQANAAYSSAGASTGVSTTADSTTIVSETTTTNADGTVTVTITYKDGHSTEATVPGSIGNPSGQTLSGDLRSTNNNIGRLVNILV